MPRPSETISIRLDQELLKLVDRRRQAFGDSRGECLKRIVVDSLTGKQESETADQILRIQEAVDRLEDQHDLRSNELTGSLRRLSFVLLSTVAGMSVDDIEMTINRIFHSQERKQ